MASSHPIEAVLHCRKDLPDDVYQLTQDILNGIYKNTVEFPLPPVTKAKMESEAKKLHSLIITSKGNSKEVLNRKAKSIEVFDLCKEVLLYVKPICKNNIELIIKSGFRISRQPAKHPVPPAPVVKEVIRHGMVNTYRMKLMKNPRKQKGEKDPTTHLRNVLYTIECTLTPDILESWVPICISKPRSQLIFNKVVPGQKNHLRVFGSNSAGDGPRSNIHYLTPEIF